MAKQDRNDPSDRERRPGKFIWFEHASRDAQKAQTFWGKDSHKGKGASNAEESG